MENRLFRHHWHKHNRFAASWLFHFSSFLEYEWCQSQSINPIWMHGELRRYEHMHIEEKKTQMEEKIDCVYLAHFSIMSNSVIRWFSGAIFLSFQVEQTKWTNIILCALHFSLWSTYYLNWKNFVHNCSPATFSRSFHFVFLASGWNSELKLCKISFAADYFFLLDLDLIKSFEGVQMKMRKSDRFLRNRKHFSHSPRIQITLYFSMNGRWSPSGKLNIHNATEYNETERNFFRSQWSGKT